jgi:hypothetical protein
MYKIIADRCRYGIHPRTKILGVLPAFIVMIAVTIATIYSMKIFYEKQI